MWKNINTAGKWIVRRLGRMFATADLAGIQCCVSCGFWTQSHLALCRFCELQLPPTPSDFSGNHIYLFPWRRHSNATLSNYLESLKCSRNLSALRVSARQLVSLALLNDRVPPRAWIVPAPTRETNRNHAAHLAKEIARILNVELRDQLQHLQEKIPQKSLGINQRQEIRFKNLGSKPRVDQPVIFIDDVLTTGETARAAWRALGRPSPFFVWTIAHRIKETPGHEKFLLD